MKTKTIEIWKPIPGYVGLYEVSNLGRVKALRRDVLHVSRNKHERSLRSIPERILKRSKRRMWIYAC